MDKHPGAGIMWSRMYFESGSKRGVGVAVGGMIEKESEAKKNNKVSEHDGMEK